MADRVIPGDGGKGTPEQVISYYFADLLDSNDAPYAYEYTEAYLLAPDNANLFPALLVMQEDGKHGDVRIGTVRKFLDLLLRRPVLLTNGRTPSTAHRALEALCRGIIGVNGQPWGGAVTISAQPPTGTKPLDPVLWDMMRRVKRLFADRLTAPFSLRVGSADIPVPAELALIDLPVILPQGRQRLDFGGRQQLVEAIVRLFESRTSRLWQWARLTPDPWRHIPRQDISDLTLKAVNRLRTQALNLATEERRRAPTLGDWLEAWEICRKKTEQVTPVTGFADDDGLARFMDSSLGQFLLADTDGFMALAEQCRSKPDKLPVPMEPLTSFRIRQLLAAERFWHLTGHLAWRFGQSAATDRTRQLAWELLRILPMAGGTAPPIPGCGALDEFASSSLGRLAVADDDGLSALARVHYGDENGTPVELPNGETCSLPQLRAAERLRDCVTLLRIGTEAAESHSELWAEAWQLRRGAKPETKLPIPTIKSYKAFADHLLGRLCLGLWVDDTPAEKHPPPQTDDAGENDSPSKPFHTLSEAERLRALASCLGWLDIEQRLALDLYLIGGVEPHLVPPALRRRVEIDGYGANLSRWTRVLIKRVCKQLDL